MSNIMLYLIEILHQTTTNSVTNISSCPLYLIEILHQTTTVSYLNRITTRLYLIEILHQTTTSSPTHTHVHRCILSKFYIKPQQFGLSPHLFSVVSYRNSTSNHNFISAPANRNFVVSYRNSTSNHNGVGRGAYQHQLYLIEILHQTTTFRGWTRTIYSCILSKFYIKPQPRINSNL